MYKAKILKIKGDDYTKAEKVSVSGIEGLERFDYDYKPLLTIEKYNLLLSVYENSNVLKELYSFSNQIYNSLSFSCYNWYDENNASEDVFDLETEIKKFYSKEIDNNCCPILKEVDFNNITDVNYYSHLEDLVIKSKIENITSVQVLLYGIEHDWPVPRDFQYTQLGNLLFNSIFNIVYKRFLNFLLEQQEKLSIKKITTRSKYFFKLKFNFTSTDCFKILVDNKFVCQNTKQSEFDKIFKEKNTSKIDWIGSIEELSRFCFYLTSDYADDNNLAPCLHVKNRNLIICKLFTINSKLIGNSQLENANRPLKNKPRKAAILKAIKSLLPKKITT